jgi:hypothetical protein
MTPADNSHHLAAATARRDVFDLAALLQAEGPLQDV